MARRKAEKGHIYHDFKSKAELIEQNKYPYLSERMAKFVDEYVKRDGRAIEAAIAAGFSESTARTRAWRFIYKPEVAAYLKEINAQRDEEVALTIEYKIGVLNNVISGLAPRDDVEARTMDPRYLVILLKAIELSAKIQGHFAPVKQLNLHAHAALENLQKAKIEYKEY